MTGRLQGPTFPTTPDRRPRGERHTAASVGTAGMIHVRLSGPVPCTAHQIGPVSARLGNLALMFTDRQALTTLPGAVIAFTEVAPLLWEPLPRQLRATKTRPLGRVSGLVEVAGREGTVTAPIVGPGWIGRPEATIGLGQAVITVADSVAAQHVAATLAQAYDYGRTLHPTLITLDQVRQRHSQTRVIPSVQR